MPIWVLSGLKLWYQKLWHLIYSGCPGVSGWITCLSPGWRWSHDSCWCEVLVIRLFLLAVPLPTFLAVFPPSGSSSSLRHWHSPIGGCMSLYLSTSLMTFIVLPTSPADNFWGKWVHYSWKSREHALWPSVTELSVWQHLTCGTVCQAMSPSVKSVETFQQHLSHFLFNLSFPGRKLYHFVNYLLLSVPPIFFI